MDHIAIQGGWQRRRDSNPRDPHGPTPLAGERLRPLGHVSVAPFSDELRGGQEAKFLNLIGMYNVGITPVLYRCFFCLSFG
jgi:hypothetical protein